MLRVARSALVPHRLSSIALKTNPNSQAMTVILVALVIIPPAFAISNELIGSKLSTCLLGKRGTPSRFARFVSFIYRLFVARLDRIFGVQSVRDLDLRATKRSTRRLKRMSDRSSELESEVSDVELDVSEPAVAVAEDVAEGGQAEGGQAEGASMKRRRSLPARKASLKLKAAAQPKPVARLNLPPPPTLPSADEPTEAVPIGSLSARFYGMRQQAPAAATAGEIPIDETVAAPERPSREPAGATVARDASTHSWGISSFFTPQATPDGSRPGSPTNIRRANAENDASLQA